MAAFFCCLRRTEANDLLLMSANFTWYSDWAFNDMPFGKHVSSIFFEVIFSASNLSAHYFKSGLLVLLCPPGIFFHFSVLLCFAFINGLSFEHIFQKGQRIVCSELQAFHPLSNTSDILQLFSEVPRLLTHSLLEAVGIIQFCIISMNLVCLMGYVLNHQAYFIDMLLDQRNVNRSLSIELCGLCVKQNLCKFDPYFKEKQTVAQWYILHSKF